VKQVIADKARRRAVRAEIDRQNLTRIGILAPIVVLLMLLFFLRERAYLDLTAEELGALFQVPAIEPALFAQVVAYRIATLLAVLLSAALVWFWRGSARLLGVGVAVFVLLVGGLLVATGTLSLAFRDAFDILYLTLFIFSALFFCGPGSPFCFSVARFWCA
jgi:asparagine N-glycosylation enzyme membrane subunit Stt3